MPDENKNNQPEANASGTGAQAPATTPATPGPAATPANPPVATPPANTPSVSDADAELQAAEAEAQKIKNAALDALKDKATDLGITFHPSIGLEKLQEKIDAVASAKSTENALQAAATNASIAKSKIPDAKKAASRLVRVVIQSLDPLKKEYDGEYFTVGNSVAGSITKLVQFGVPWHVPFMFVNALKEKQYQSFTKKKTPDGGTITQTGSRPAYAVEILPDLTQEEINELAKLQLTERPQ